jgi:hypothetical protein
MAAVTIRARGPLDAATAWERYARPARWPSWSPQIRHVDYPGDRLEPGATGRVVGPAGVAVAFTVDEFDDTTRTWSWTVRLPLVRLRLAHGVTSDARGCATWLRMNGPLPLVLCYLPLARLALHRLVR